MWKSYRCGGRRSRDGLAHAGPTLNPDTNHRNPSKIQPTTKRKFCREAHLLHLHSHRLSALQLEKIDDVDEETFRDAKSIIELLKENLSLWKEEEGEAVVDDL